MPLSRPWPTTRQTLLVRIRSPEEREAWNEFIDLYLPLIYRHCRTCGLQDSDAQDVAQDVLVRVSQAIRKFEYDPTRGRFRGWLGVLVRREIYRHAKRQDRAGKAPGDGLVDAFADQTPTDLESEWSIQFTAHVYRCALQRIRPAFDSATWNAFEAVWIHHRKPGEVARELDKRPAWVYQAKYLVLRRLKEEILHISDDALPLHMHSD